MKKGIGLFTFVGGALIGAGAALLFAPKPGKDARKDVKKWLDKRGEDGKLYYGKGRAWVASKTSEGKDLVEKGKHGASTQKDKVLAAVKAGKKAYANGTKEKAAA